MAQVTGFTAERMKQIEDSAVVDGEIVGSDLILITKDGTQINAGRVVGPPGPPGGASSATQVPYGGGPGMSASNVEDALDELAVEKADKAGTPTNADLTALVPAGCIMPWAGTAAGAPAGWVFCNGAELSRSTYAALFAAIGTQYGAGNGTTTFNIPAAGGRTLVGQDATADFNSLGKVGGEKTHLLISSEMPAHSHGVNDPGHSHVTGQSLWALGGGPISWAAGTWTIQELTDARTTGVTIQNAGGGAAHNVLQPYLTIRYIIKT